MPDANSGTAQDPATNVQNDAANAQAPPFPQIIGPFSFQLDATASGIEAIHAAVTAQWPSHPNYPSAVPSPPAGADGLMGFVAGGIIPPSNLQQQPSADDLDALGPVNFTSFDSIIDMILTPPPHVLARWAQHERFDAAAFVDTLEEVDISTIPAEDMRCPHCWLPFGTTEEDDPAFVPVSESDMTPELAERQTIFHELAFDASRPDNDPVRTPCGHVFGRGCLIESMEKVGTRCPMCRQELRPKPEIPDLTDQVDLDQGPGEDEEL